MTNNKKKHIFLQFFLIFIYVKMAYISVQVDIHEKNNFKMIADNSCCVIGTLGIYIHETAHICWRVIHIGLHTDPCIGTWADDKIYVTQTLVAMQMQKLSFVLHQESIVHSDFTRWH